MTGDEKGKAKRPEWSCEECSACGPSSPDITTAGALPLPDFDVILEASVPTSRHVPKSARNVWAETLAATIDEVNRTPEDIAAWKRLLMLPRCVLAAPKRSGKAHHRELSSSVTTHLRRWQNGEIMELWAESHGHDRRGQVKRRKVSEPSQREANARRARTACQDGQYGKAVQALMSDGLADATDETLAELLRVHPQVPQPQKPVGPLQAPLKVRGDTVARCVRSFPAGTAPGPSALRATHLKEALECPAPASSDKVLLALTQLIQILADGFLPVDVAPHFCGANLFACKKKNGGIRPIAVGEVLRRLASKVLVQLTSKEAASLLSPLQVGVSISGGCEAIVHAASSLQSDDTIPADEKLTLLVDFVNAFNSIDREEMFRAIRSRLPALSHWIESVYSVQPVLRFGSHIILSCAGVQQGDPLGPLCFSLTLQSLIEKIQEQAMDIRLNAWLLDDGTLVGKEAHLQRALDIIESDGPALGLRMNRSKSLLFVPEGATSPVHLPAEIPRTSDGFPLLGSAVGEDELRSNVCMRRLVKIKEILGRLPDLKDAHMEATLLRKCLAFPKIAFALRTFPPNVIAEVTHEFDNSIRAALGDLLGSDIPDWSWKKASLPAALGGFALRSASRHAPAAFLGSVSETRGLVARLLKRDTTSPHVSTALGLLAVSCRRPDWSSMTDIEFPASQKNLSRAVDTQVYKELLDTAPSTRHKALAISSSIPHAGDWLDVLPSSSLGLHLKTWEFRSCAHYWLGLRMSSNEAPCTVCGKPSDVYGDHAVGCGGSNDRITRHDLLCDALFSVAQSAALAPRKEVPGLIPGSRARPADLYLPAWPRGTPTALDVRVVSSLQKVLVQAAATDPGSALAKAKSEKIAKHADPCQQVGVKFIPLVVEVLGGWEGEAAETIAGIGRLQGQRLGTVIGTTVQHLFQRLAISLCRGNAALWSRRARCFPASVDGIV